MLKTPKSESRSATEINQLRAYITELEEEINQSARDVTYFATTFKARTLLIDGIKEKNKEVKNAKKKLQDLLQEFEANKRRE